MIFCRFETKKVPVINLEVINNVLVDFMMVDDGVDHLDDPAVADQEYLTLIEREVGKERLQVLEVIGVGFIQLVLDAPVDNDLTP